MSSRIQISMTRRIKVVSAIREALKELYVKCPEGLTPEQVACLEAQIRLNFGVDKPSSKEFLDDLYAAGELKYREAPT